MSIPPDQHPDTPAASASPLKLSVLDLVSVRQGQTTGQAMRASKAIVDTADRLGFTRYWVAEHHNMPSVASTEPGIELMYFGQGTERIRLGSGGVMLPNHAPLAIAEQFALLTAVYGDRIDLGIGRAPGTDPITSAAMRGHLGEGRMVDRSGNPIDPVEQFPQHVMDILALLRPEGAEVRLTGDRVHVLRPTPELDAVPQMWLLGSSGYSAQLAAALGLPYVFAHHFAGRGTEAALNLYRDSFTATEHGSTPRTFVTVNASVADTEEEARLLAEPYMYTMASLRVGTPMERLRNVGEDVRSVMTDGHRHVAEPMVRTWAVGTPQQVAAQLRETAAEFGVDEVMIQPVAGAYPEDPVDAWPARIRTLELLAAEVLA
ncbi:LLM class flavin-dependent oxidoreductase [Brevibacterium daeguense]|uniref:LLM class flavin-dependent oxidoreductase n=1 Tax=Brevibacterium daeguense TaxID=909936 RepID=A0ABP8EGT0_9MICO|nr:LLM class flavin-dependent oxidoreductase [Brevibacterium daeguense]